MEKFIKFLEGIKEGEEKKITIKSEDNIETIHCKKDSYKGNSFIIYEDVAMGVGVIQDSPVAPWQDYAEAFYEKLTNNGEYDIEYQTFQV